MSVARLLEPVIRIPKRYPFAFGVITAAVKTGGADYMVQKFVEKKKATNWRRVGGSFLALLATTS
jgi:hypothetical protein